MGWTDPKFYISTSIFLCKSRNYAYKFRIVSCMHGCAMHGCIVSSNYKHNLYLKIFVEGSSLH